jgi:hypothetical protein
MVEHWYAVPFMVSVTYKAYMLNVDMLIVVMLSVVMLSVVAPLNASRRIRKKKSHLLHEAGNTK